MFLKDNLLYEPNIKLLNDINQKNTSMQNTSRIAEPPIEYQISPTQTDGATPGRLSSSHAPRFEDQYQPPNRNVLSIKLAE